MAGLKNFVEMAEVREKLNPLQQQPRPRITAPLKALPRSERYMLLGTAIDYLLRFEIQRRSPRTVAKAWIAESSVTRFAERAEIVAMTSRAKSPPPFVVEMSEQAERSQQVLREAKAAVNAYIKSQAPTRKMRTEVAQYALRLARLDSYYRCGKFDPLFEEAATEDVDDLLSMLRIVPFSALLPGKRIMLNPTFGEASQIVGGGDADLIAGDMLVDFKTMKEAKTKLSDLNQLLGYFLLASRHRCTNPRFPQIKRVGIYFCRHGYLWYMNVSVWTGHPEFHAIEKWFFKRAAKVGCAS